MNTLVYFETWVRGTWLFNDLALTRWVFVLRLTGRADAIFPLITRAFNTRFLDERKNKFNREV